MRRVGAGLAALAVITLSACASATPAGTVAAAPSHPASAPPPSGPPVPDPGTREALHPDPNFDYGFVVQITDAGFHPHTLLSGCCKPVTWRNLTRQPVSVDFDHQLVRSTLIPPGGTWVFLPHNPESITYHAGTSPQMVGLLQVQQSVET